MYPVDAFTGGVPPIPTNIYLRVSQKWYSDLSFISVSGSPSSSSLREYDCMLRSSPISGASYASVMLSIT